MGWVPRSVLTWHVTGDWEYAGLAVGILNLAIVVPQVRGVEG